jgi:hypothetical protein
MQVSRLGNAMPKQCHKIPECLLRKPLYDTSSQMQICMAKKWELLHVTPDFTGTQMRLEDLEHQSLGIEWTTSGFRFGTSSGTV